MGYRGPEVDPNLNTIIVSGASETFGIHENPGHEYPRQLQAILAEDYSQKWNVLNIAVPGMRHGRVGYLDRALKQTHAKLVIIYPSPANYIGVLRPYCGSPAPPVVEDQGYSKHVRMVDKAGQLAKRMVSPKVRSFVEEISVRNAESKTRVMAKVPGYSIAAFRKDLECAVEVAHRNGARVLLATHATYFGENVQPGDERMLIAWRYFYPSLGESGFLDLERRANSAVMDVARHYGTEVLDGAKLMPRGSIYFADFVHFSDDGAKQFAELLAKVVSGLTL
jgi:hypothetical protein